MTIIASFLVVLAHQAAQTDDRSIYISSNIGSGSPIVYYEKWRAAVI